MSMLIVRVWPDCWGFESPPGEIFNLEKLPKQQRQQAAELFDKRFDLSPNLAGKIASEIKFNESAWGTVKQFAFGLLLPAGLLLGNTFDLDRDSTILKGEVAAVLSTVFSSHEYRIVESIGEGKFSNGKLILKIIF
ncbi:hypothetical protein Ndes2526B_g04013 [Nannochloris sp. 'desiccata']